MKEKLKETMNWLKKQNLYAATDVMAVITLLLLIAFVATGKKKEILFSAGIVGCAGVLTAGIHGMFGKSKIENESEETICTKGEEDCDATELSAGDSRYDVDGVKSRGTVYKFGNGCHAVARKDGTVKVKSITGKCLNWIFDGGVLTEPPAVDKECWQKLFDC